MNEFFSDNAWKVSTLLAAAFGGFLTIWIGKFFRWFFQQFSKESRANWRIARVQVKARRERVFEEVVNNPMLIVLNTLYIALIFTLVISVAALVAAYPMITEGAKYSIAIAKETICPSTNYLLSMYCDSKPIGADWLINDKNLLKYFWIVAPILFFYLILFFCWFWVSLFYLISVYRRALKGRSIASLWF